LKLNKNLADSVNFARNEVFKVYGFRLGNFIQYSEQIVSGINHRMVFETSLCLVEVVVYNQPCTKTLELKSLTKMRTY
jgi:hypothetical protein